jgi:hypothetical protein
MRRKVAVAAAEPACRGHATRWPREHCSRKQEEIALCHYNMKADEVLHGELCGLARFRHGWRTRDAGNSVRTKETESMLKEPRCPVAI